MKLKEEKFDIKTFIGGWYIPKKICTDLINFFEKSQWRHQPGVSYVDHNIQIVPDIKESTDMYIWGYDTIFDQYNKYLQKALLEYFKKYPELQTSYMRFDSYQSKYNIQRYLPKQGYKKDHCERAGGPTNRRCLVFMTYLNTVKDGGTHFKYQNLTTSAKQGLTLFWPTDFTHVHRGQICDQTKYIVTGWYEFQE
jgi:prolyl 4-hydroxylase